MRVTGGVRGTKTGAKKSEGPGCQEGHEKQTRAHNEMSKEFWSKTE